MDNFLRLENRHTGEILRMRRVHDAQGQIVLTLDGSLPPRASGPPLHVHFHEHEEGIVRAGTLGAQVGTEKFIVPAGGTAVLPAGLPHRWWNAGDDLLEFSGQVVPAGTWIATSKRCLPFSTPALTAGHRSSISRTCSGAIARCSRFQFRLQPFSEWFYLSCCLLGASRANTADRAGPVRPSRALVRRLWTLRPRAAPLVAALLRPESDSCRIV